MLRFLFEELKIKNLYKSFIVNFLPEYQNKKNYISKKIINNFNIKNIIQNIEKEGFYLFNDFLEKDYMDQLNSEFEKVIRNKKNTLNDKNANTIQVRYFNKLNLFDENLMNTFSIFNNEQFRKIIHKLYRTKFYYNNQIFFQQTNLTNEPTAGEVHFDILHQYKIWIFLNDVDENNGPIEIFPKSHIENKITRIKSYKDAKRFDNRANRIDKLIGKKIKANSGSILIFDSDVFHRATSVRKGSRKIIRAHSMVPSTIAYRNELKRNLHQY